MLFFLADLRHHDRHAGDQIDKPEQKKRDEGVGVQQGIGSGNSLKRNVIEQSHRHEADKPDVDFPELDLHPLSLRVRTLKQADGVDHDAQNQQDQSGDQTAG